MILYPEGLTLKNIKDIDSDLHVRIQRMSFPWPFLRNLLKNLFQGALPEVPLENDFGQPERLERHPHRTSVEY